MSETIEPDITDLNKPFWDAAARGELLLPHCVKSGKSFWPPSPLSPFVTNGPVEWRPVEPHGVLRSLVTYRRVFQKALAELIPYRIGLVELAGGVRLLAHLAGESGAPAVGDVVCIELAPLRRGARRVPIISVQAGNGA